MSIALVVSDNRDAIVMLPWAVWLARLRSEPLLILSLNQQGKQVQRREIGLPSKSPPDEVGDWGSLEEVAKRLEAAGCVHTPNSDGPSESDEVGFRIIQLQQTKASQAICEEITTSSIKSILLRRGNKDLDQSLDKQVIHEIVSDAPCEVIQIRVGKVAMNQCSTIAVPAGLGNHVATAFSLAKQLADHCQAKLSGVYVEPNVDEYAKQVGAQILDRRLKATLGGDANEVERRVVLDSHVQTGIRSITNEYDVIVIGSRHHGRMHRWFVRGLSEELLSLDEGPTILSVRSSTPLSGRILSSIDRALRHSVPQLERAQRIAVVERIQSSSKWDFDFIALVCLSTLIATGGLIQNSSAVVIGAMLVAPLMTPLLGAGLSLVQGNLVLLRSAVESIIRGFLLAVAIGIVVGWLWPGIAVTPEMAARGAPSVLDLIVALISGMAAAYAIGRPNLLSALPGVAIAAALVPPIATLGLSIPLGEWQLAIGSGLLFVTNIVAIVLGTACSFLAVGIRGSHTHGAFQSQSLRVAIGLILLFVALGIYESVPKQRLSDSFSQDMHRLINQTSGVRLGSIVHSKRREGDHVTVVIDSEQPISKKTSEAITTIARKNFPTPVQIHIENRRVKIIRID
ncbi:MAG: DUF389 domain-containing protein [Planctomycetaceae bacterium]|nr:DUF389 domain-containing protein [Planctomycetaceae bacterium]